MKKLVIVQPYIPKYRVKFFNLLIDSLAKNNIETIVAAGMPQGADDKRSDSTSAPWHVETSTPQIKALGHTLTLGGSYKTWHKADGVIVGHLGSSLDTYRAILASKTRELRVGLWGHIESYVNESHPLDAALERWQLKQADHIFAYTPGGALVAQKTGVKTSKITTVMNSVDTQSLTEAIQSTTETAIDNFLNEHRIDPRSTLSYIGGLDESKRITFLVEALNKLWVLNPSIKLLVAGHGNQSFLLDNACRRGQVIKLGYAGPALQALMARASRALLMPGRIGLVAVEALVLNLPIISTDWKYHSAEIEYLTKGTTLLTTPDFSSAYAERIMSFIAESKTSDLSKSIDWTYPSIEDMVGNFATGVIAMMTRGKNE